jgi:hypothetical protein
MRPAPPCTRARIGAFRIGDASEPAPVLDLWRSISGGSIPGGRSPLAEPAARPLEFSTG